MHVVCDEPKDPCWGAPSVSTARFWGVQVASGSGWGQTIGRTHQNIQSPDLKHPARQGRGARKGGATLRFGEGRQRGTGSACVAAGGCRWRKEEYYHPYFIQAHCLVAKRGALVQPAS